MYTFSNRLKIASFILMAVGVLGIGIGFVSAPGTVDEAKAMVAAHDDGHGDSHGEEASHATASDHGEASDHSDAHDEHLLHQLQNRPWSALYVAAFFFFMIALGVLAFYGIQYASQAGWSPVLFRVMEGITAYILPGSILLFVFLLFSGFHMNHIYVWMAEGTFDPTSEHYDAIIDGKSWWLNTSGWLIRSFIYLFVYNIFRYMLRKNSLALDVSGDITIYKKNFNLSVAFIVLFGIIELFMSFDWLMSLDPHWYSQLYSFYVFASVLVSAITTIALVTIYLRNKGVLPFVNDSHIHDLAKYMFGFSIFWTYFWFDQFMLQWYANIPEEAAYFFPRLIGSYQLPFISMLVMNFVFPILILMNSDFKRVPWYVVTAGLVILTGHYIDIFQLVSPATVGDSWSIGIPELGSLAFFLGLFIYVVFSAIAKAPLHAKGNPFMKESEIYHY